MTVFRVEIRRGQAEGTFHVRGASPLAGEASADVELDAEALRACQGQLQWAISRSPAADQVQASEDLQLVREIGGQLFTALLGSKSVGRRYQASLAAAEQRRESLKVVLQVNDPDLAGLPWESMYDEDTKSYLSHRVPLIRQVDVPAAVGPLAVNPPLRILGVVSSPVDGHALDVEREKAGLQNALKSLVDAGKAEVVWAPAATWQGIQRTLLDGPWHAVHYIGHGGFDENRNEGVLALIDEGGRMNLVEASRLVVLLGHAKPRPQLVVLNSCSGAFTGKDLFSSTAAALILGSFTAVVAMQYEIRDRAAAAFTGGFYDAIASGREVDDAVSSGRTAIIGQSGGTLEWLSPVLYLRGDDCCLFTMRQPDTLESRLTKNQPREPKPQPLSQPEPAPVISTLVGHDGGVSSLAFSPDGSLLASAGYDGTVRLWTVATGAESNKLTGYAQAAGRLAFSQDGRLLACASHDGSVILWEWEVSGPPRTLEGCNGQVSSVAFSPDGSLLAYTNNSERVGIWEIGAGAMHGFTGHEGNVQDVAFSPDGQLLASAGGYDHTVRLWNVKSGKVLWPFNQDGTRADILTGHTGMVTRVAFSPNGNQLASAGANIEERHIPGIPGRTRPVVRQGRTDRTVRLWNVNTGLPERTFEGHTDGVQDVAFSSDGRLLASAALDRTVRFWDVDAGKTVHKLTGHTSGIPRIAFSPDGSLLAAAGSSAQPIHLVTDFWQ